MTGSFYRPGMTVGLMKGGQLGRMLIQAAIPFGVRFAVMDSDGQAPCRRVCDSFFQGDVLSFDDVYAFGKSVDLLTFEYEHVHSEALLKLQSEGKTIYPSPDILKIIQDKGEQKKFYKKHGIPTAEFSIVDSSEIASFGAFLPAVQKLCRSGYDGKGVQTLDSASDFHKALQGSSVLEKKVLFEKEISVLLARSRAGDIRVYPVVELLFHPEANLVTHLFSPAKIDPKVEKKAVEIACRIAELLGVVGVLAVEMFVLPSGDVLVNEAAPRPHNSGHHTIEACRTSQFEQHFRAVAGLPLGSVEMLSPSVMVNLLGEPGFEGETRVTGLAEVLTMEGVHVHLYGKQKTKPFRKMGHVTVLDSSLERAKQKADDVLKTIRIIS